MWSCDSFFLLINHNAMKGRNCCVTNVMPDTFRRSTLLQVRQNPLIRWANTFCILLKCRNILINKDEECCSCSSATHELMWFSFYVTAICSKLLHICILGISDIPIHTRRMISRIYFILLTIWMIQFSVSTTKSHRVFAIPFPTNVCWLFFYSAFARK